MLLGWLAGAAAVMKLVVIIELLERGCTYVRSIMLNSACYIQLV
jgi:hypothetical protein